MCLHFRTRPTSFEGGAREGRRGRRRLKWCSTVGGGVGRTKVGGKVGLKLKKLNLNVQQISHVIMSTHDHIQTLRDCVTPSPPTTTGMPSARCPSPLMRDVGLSAWAKMRGDKGG